MLFGRFQIKISDLSDHGKPKNRIFWSSRNSIRDLTRASMWMGGVEKHQIILLWSRLKANGLSSLASDSARKLNVLGHDGHALGMNRAQVGVLEKTNQVRLRRLLQSHHRR